MCCCTQTKSSNSVVSNEEAQTEADAEAEMETEAEPGSERILSASKRTFLGATANGSLLSISKNSVLGIFYGFLVILAITLSLVGLIVFRKRKEWKERQSRRGSALLQRYRIGMDKVDE